MLRIIICEVTGKKQKMPFTFNFNSLVRRSHSQINQAMLSEWICYLHVRVILYRRNDILLFAVQSNCRWFTVLTRCRVSHHDTDLWRSVNI